MGPAMSAITVTSNRQDGRWRRCQVEGKAPVDRQINHAVTNSHVPRGAISSQPFKQQHTT